MSIPTVSLETAKLLKENGFRQDSQFSWNYAPFTEPELTISPSYAAINCSCSAPTSDELLAELPYRIKFFEGDIGATLSIEIHDDGVKFFCYYAKHLGHVAICCSELNESLPEALANLYLYLAKENLLPLKESRKV